MNSENMIVSKKRREKLLEKEKARKEKKKKKKNALVICANGQEFWTTQTQFWQWVRDQVVIKISDGPLKGKFLREHEEYQVVISGTVLNLKHPLHLSEALYQKRKAHF